jgi:hypothetical protein
MMRAQFSSSTNIIGASHHHLRTQKKSTTAAAISDPFHTVWIGVWSCSCRILKCAKSTAMAWNTKEPASTKTQPDSPKLTTQTGPPFSAWRPLCKNAGIVPQSGEPVPHTAEPPNGSRTIRFMRAWPLVSHQSGRSDHPHCSYS